MGVDRTHYLMVGIDVGCEAFDWDKHEAEQDGAPDARFDLVYDGMSGQYCMAGKIIAAGDEYDGFGRTEINPEKLDVDKDELAAKISDAFGKPISAADLRLHLFTHFS